MFLFSTRSYLAIDAVLDVALKRGAPVLARTIWRQQQVAPRYLDATMQALVHAGVLHAARGPGGGYRLAKAVEDIRLWEIDRAVRNTETPEQFPGYSPMTHLGNKIVKPLLSELEHSRNESLKRLSLRQVMDKVDTR